MMRTTARRSTTDRPRSTAWTRPAPSRPVLVVVAIVAVLGVTVAACSGGSSSPEAGSPSSTVATPPSPSTTTTAPEWAEIDRRLSALGPDVGFLAASVSSDGTCRPVHEISPSTARPTASQFKLFVLGALADAIAAGDIAWDRTLTVQDTTRSLGNGEGSLQEAASGTTVSVEETATKMISISDNTAADMLIGLLGRNDVEAKAHQWMADASANDPFLTTREMLLLHYAPGLADRYLATPRARRAGFLASSVDPLPLTAIGAGYSTAPRHIGAVEWFASPEDVCGAFAGLQELSTNKKLAPVSTVLSRERGGIELGRSDWPTVWYKGGSEPGVLTLGWLATNSQGETFVVEAMVSNPDAALSDDSITKLVALAQDAFALLA